MDFVETIKKRQALKKELQLLRENRKPEDIITVTRASLVIKDNDYVMVRKKVQTTHAEMELEKEIAALKMQANSSSGLKPFC